MTSHGAKAHTSMIFFVLAILLFWSSMCIYLSTLAVYAEALGASSGLVGAILGSYGLAQLLCRLPVGVWSDRLGRRRPFILAGVVLAGIGALGLGLSTDPAWLVVWRGTAGAGAAGWVAITVLFSSYFPPEKATRAMSYLNFLSAAAMMASTYAGGVIAQLWGWEAPFYAGVGLAVAGFLATLPLEERLMPARRAMAPRDLLRIGTVPQLVAVSVVSMLGAWTIWVTAYGFTGVYAARLGASRADLGVLTALSQMTLTGGMLLGGRMPEWIGARATMIVGSLLQAAGAFMVPWAGSLPLVAVSQLLGGAGRGIPYPVLMAMGIQAVSPADRATAVGVFQAVYALGMFIGPASAGLIGDAFGFLSIFYVAGAASLLAIAVVLARVPEGR